MIIQNIIIIILGIICGFLCFFLLKKKEIEKTTNEQVKQELDKLLEEKNNLEKNINISYAKRDEILNSFNLLKKQSEENANQYKEDQIKIAQEQANQQIEKIQSKLDKTLEDISNEYQKNIEDCQQTYLSVLNEASEEVQNYLSQIVENKKQLKDIQNKVITAIELEKTRQADKLAEQKYKISLSQEDLIEINRLREVAPFLRNARPVYKIIWEGYYRNPTNDLITRVLGNKNITGIYILTNTLNNYSYIGQAVNVSDRWKQHIKCGLGIDAPNNILYQAMKKDGVENFKFQLIEKCNREELNDKEKYWINFYKTNDFGYNMNRGIKKQ